MNIKVEEDKEVRLLTRLKAGIESSDTNIMMCDEGRNIVYLNPAFAEFMKQRSAAFKQTFPGFDPNNLLGQNIDQFHKNPAHQKALLADESRLPVSAKIEVQDYIFSIRASMIKGNKGEYIGNMLEWSDITEKEAQKRETDLLRAGIEGSDGNLMMCDENRDIVYLNPAFIKFMKQRVDAFQYAFPGFDPDNIVGQNIDQFHKNPAHQKTLLADESRLPFSAKIKVQDLIFSINATMIKGSDGEYMGNMLEWADVTEKEAQKRETALLRAGIDGSNASLMMCDENRDIVYLNPAFMKFMQRRIDAFQQTFPGFDPNNIVGQNIDQFHRDPEHQKTLLADESRLPFLAEIKLQEFTFSINATMIKGPEGEYMGNMLEWADVTNERDAEKQIRRLVKDAAQGEFSSRVDSESYDRFLNQLGTLLNELMSTCEESLRDVANVIKQIAQGDLTATVTADYQGLFDELKNDVNETVENLRAMVERIATTSFSISTSASEISQGNHDLSQRTEEQASSLEETASSMEEMMSTVKASAENAREANQLSNSAQEQAEAGGKVVSEAVKAMNAISGSSKQITENIGVIDEIAFQTNLLALNAAVEAARAGEQGRGFAVVAAEVRNLAQRSATAAKEIKSLIKDSAEKVRDGHRLVGESGQTLEDIVNAVKKVSDIISEIAAASHEQSIGIEEVNKAINQLDEVTQHNAALVEEAAASSQAMDDESKNLNKLVGRFNMGTEDESEQQTDPFSRQWGSKTPDNVSRKTRAAHEPSQLDQPSRQPQPVEESEEWEEF